MRRRRRRFRFVSGTIPGKPASALPIAVARAPVTGRSGFGAQEFPETVGARECGCLGPAEGGLDAGPRRGPICVGENAPGNRSGEAALSGRSGRRDHGATGLQAPEPARPLPGESGDSAGDRLGASGRAVARGRRRVRPLRSGTQALSLLWLDDPVASPGKFGSKVHLLRRVGGRSPLAKATPGPSSLLGVRHQFHPTTLPGRRESRQPRRFSGPGGPKAPGTV